MLAAKPLFPRFATREPTLRSVISDFLSCLTFSFTASENYVTLNVIFFDFRIAILVHSGKFGNVYDGLC